MSSPRLSICIPTFNRLRFLQEAVASARAQTLGDVEIVISDDGDSDDLRSWCLSEVRLDPRIRYEKTPRRLGLAGNWNFLSTLARGEYMTLMGDDDRLLPTFAEKLLCEVHDQVSVVFCNHHIIDSAGRRLDAKSFETTAQFGRAGLSRGLLSNTRELAWGGVVPMSASIVRVADVRRLGFKNDINTPDIELFVRMANEGSPFAFVEEYLAEYRTHEGSATSSGLTIDRLAEHLERVEVPSHIETAKRSCLEPLLMAGIGVRLKRGDIEGARNLLSSRYFPRSIRNPRSAAQRLILGLPERWIGPAYSWLRLLDRRFRQARRQQHEAGE